MKQIIGKKGRLGWRWGKEPRRGIGGELSAMTLKASITRTKTGNEV